MLHLLTPLGLLSLAALAVPVYLHLRRRPSLVVRLGSLSFLDGRIRPSLDRLRWRERWLLALRILLLCCAALLLARPEWLRRAGSPERWALVSADAELSGPSLERWRQALRDGYDARVLGPGLPRLGSRLPGSRAAEPEDVWSLLREADARLAAGSSVLVFSPLRSDLLRGARPTLVHAAVAWVQTPSAPVPAVPGQLAGGPGPVRVAVLVEASRVADGRAVEAALTAVASACGRPVEVEVNPPPAAVAAAQWIFHLGGPPGASPAEEAALRRGAVLVCDAGAAADVPSSVIATDQFFTARAGAPGGPAFARRTALWRRVGAPDDAGAVLWSDASGQPVLSMKHVGPGRWFHYWSRFNPEWSDWTLSGAFPLWVGTLVLPEWAGGAPARPDSRQADPGQAGVDTVLSGPAAAGLPSAAPLERILWWTLLGLFGAERCVAAARVRRGQGEGPS